MAGVLLLLCISSWAHAAQAGNDGEPKIPDEAYANGTCPMHSMKLQHTLLLPPKMGFIIGAMKSGAQDQSSQCSAQLSSSSTSRALNCLLGTRAHRYTHSLTHTLTLTHSHSHRDHVPLPRAPLATPQVCLPGGHPRRSEDPGQGGKILRPLAT